MQEKEKREDYLKGLREVIHVGHGLAICEENPIILGTKQVFIVKEIVNISYQGFFDKINGADLEKRFGLKLFYYPKTRSYYLCYTDYVIERFSECPNYDRIKWTIMEYGNYLGDEFSTIQNFLLYLEFFCEIRDELKYRLGLKQLKYFEPFITKFRNKFTSSKVRLKERLANNRYRFFRDAQDVRYGPGDIICKWCGKETDSSYYIIDQFGQYFNLCVDDCGARALEFYKTIKYPKKIPLFPKFPPKLPDINPIPPIDIDKILTPATSNKNNVLEEATIEIQDLSEETIEKIIFDYIDKNKGKKIYPSDIAFAFNLDVEKVFNICEKLKKEGKLIDFLANDKQNKNVI